MLQVINLANLEIDTPCLGTPALTVNGVTDTSGGGIITNNQSGSCTVSQAAINITTTSLPGVVVGGTYNQTVQSAGGYGPHTFVCRNAGLTVACTTVLPPGLDMNASGVISGGGWYTLCACQIRPFDGKRQRAICCSTINAQLAIQIPRCASSSIYHLYWLGYNIVFNARVKPLWGMVLLVRLVCLQGSAARISTTLGPLSLVRPHTMWHRKILG